MPADHLYLGLARAQAAFSRCERPVGAVATGPEGEVRSSGYNGLPRRLRDDVPERGERPAKYLWEEHAERNAVYQAARAGVSLAGGTLYVWVEGERDRLGPCADCARAVIQAGLVRVVTRHPAGPVPERWAASCAAAAEMLAEAGVELTSARDPDGCHACGT